MSACLIGSIVSLCIYAYLFIPMTCAILIIIMPFLLVQEGARCVLMYMHNTYPVATYELCEWKDGMFCEWKALYSVNGKAVFTCKKRVHCTMDKLHVCM